MNGDLTGPRPIAHISGLTVRWGDVVALRNLSLALYPATRTALVGESGSGKSLTAAALLGLLPPRCATTGSVTINGTELHGAPEAAWRRIRGTHVGLIAQDPRTCLNPLVRIIDHVAEPLRGQGIARSVAQQRAMELLQHVRLPDPATLATRFPGQLSGGQRQRVGIAMALAAQPSLLIADEPTSALDVTVQAEILPLITAVTTKTALLFITHDIAIAAQLCDRLVVLRAGEIVADGPTSEVVSTPHHPYVHELLTASAATSLTAACASLLHPQGQTWPS